MKSAFFRAGHLAHIYQNAAIAGIGDAGGVLSSVAPGQLFFGLHTLWPGGVGRVGTQDTNELSYTSYARVGIDRDATASGFSVVDFLLTNQPIVTFPNVDAGESATPRYATLGIAAAGATSILDIMPLCTFIDAFAVVDAAAPNTIAVCPGHSLVVNDEVAFFEIPDSTFPGGLTEGDQYFVETVVGNVITVSATAGPGAQLDLTTAGCGLVAKMSVQTLAAGATPEIRESQFRLVEA